MTYTLYMYTNQYSTAKKKQIIKITILLVCTVAWNSCQFSLSIIIEDVMAAYMYMQYIVHQVLINFCVCELKTLLMAMYFNTLT